VTLKANSSLRHPRRWSADQDREVWLAGEAFFHVTKKMIRNSQGMDQRPATFVVHATEVVDVAVLGTEFNVSTRDEETEVVLKSGSVRVEVKHEAQPQTLLMEPGDRVAVAHRRGTLTQQQIDPHAPAAWRDNMLIFNEVTLAEVAKKLRHTYGVAIVFQDPALAQRKFKGFVPADNLDVLLEAFAELYNIRIKRNGNQLIFSEAPNPP
jgi:ferric-dicitrate binding protein FerR (iron transport regulator)